MAVVEETLMNYYHYDDTRNEICCLFGPLFEKESIKKGTHVLQILKENVSIEIFGKLSYISLEQVVKKKSSEAQCIW